MLQQVDHELADATYGVYTFRVHGTIYHEISRSMQPPAGVQPGFSQFYIHDPELQIDQRRGVFDGLDPEILRSLQAMLDRENPYAAIYRTAGQRLAANPDERFSIVLRSCRDDSRGHYGQYLRPATAEIAAVVPRYDTEITAYRDAAVVSHGGGLIRINEQHPLYDPLHYVLMFPRGEQGWMAPLPNRARSSGRVNGNSFPFSI